MRTVAVRAGETPYEVCVGRGLLGGLAGMKELSGLLGGARLLVATDETVRRLHGQALERGLEAAGAKVAGWVAMPPGERHKTLDSARLFWDALVDARMERGDLLVAFGGGVVGDVAGFAAATYQRGIRFAQVPTTLLAMVDSSVGGKTGIDHPRGKNLIGAFHQPSAVLADLDLLATLPRREALSGLAEVIKAAILADPELFELLEREGPGIAGNPEALEEAVARAVEVKARVVGSDEKERGPRALLNLGHTFGHAVETVTAYRGPTHGEAVAQGILFATELSRRLGGISDPEARRIENLIHAWGYPLNVEGLRADTIKEAIRYDKKRTKGATLWVLPRAVGRAEWGQAVEDTLVDALLAEVLTRR